MEVPMTSLVRLFTVAGFMACTAGVAQAAPCIQAPFSTYLATGFSCTVNDKTFSGFSYVPTVTGGAVATPAANVTVVPVPVLTPLTLPGPSLEFDDAWAVGPGQTSDIKIGFTVTAGPGFLIDDLSARLTGTVTGNGSIKLGETVQSISPAEVFAQQACIPGAVGCPLGGFTDVLLPLATASLIVTKDVILTGGTGTADLSVIDNQFSQSSTVIPEPTSLALIGVGLLGIRVLARRRGRA
jgi:hypothetical protein